MSRVGGVNYSLFPADWWQFLKANIDRKKEPKSGFLRTITEIISMLISSSVFLCVLASNESIPTAEICLDQITRVPNSVPHLCIKRALELVWIVVI